MNVKQGANSVLFWKIFIICALSALLNILLSYLVNGIFRLPLYLDTVFTAAVCFSAGLIPGIITGIVFPAVLIPFKYIYMHNYPLETSWPVYFFLICALCEIILICVFHKRIKPVEAAVLNDHAGRKTFFQVLIFMATQLLVLAALDCIIVSVLGGIIGYTVGLLSLPRSLYPEDTFLLGLLRNNVHELVSAVLSRIPINVVDRFIVVFAGYGISLLYRKRLKSYNN